MRRSEREEASDRAHPADLDHDLRAFGPDLGSHFRNQNGHKPARLLDIEVGGRADAWVLASAVAGQADVLVTGDQDLLVLGNRAPVPVLDPRGFWTLARRSLGEP